MSAFNATLGPKQLGAEVLLHIARQRLTGTLTFGVELKTRQLVFKDGRPEAGIESDQVAAAGRPEVAQLVRVFAATSSGRCAFVPGAPQVATSLGIDTLGEALVAIMQLLTPTQLDGFFAARGKYTVEPLANFAKFAQAVEKVGGPRLTLPAPGSTLMALVSHHDGPVQRAWAALLLLGGLRSDAPPVSLESTAAPAAPPVDAPTARVKGEIDEAFGRAALDHYGFLGVARDAPQDVVRKAYFEQAKLWHSDRFANLTLDAETRRRGEELFRRAEEANRILSNAEDRKTYDWILARQALGLPTDPNVVLEAEGLFHKAEGLVRRGQAAAAEPLLRKAVEMNKGEAEFWAFLGFAIFSAKGAPGAEEALGCINKSLAMSATLDAAHEFLGRIAHIQGDIDAARQHFRTCIELNPKNRDAEREMRLLSLREEQAKAEKKQGAKDTSILGRFLKR